LRAALEHLMHDRRATALLSLALVGGLVALALSKLDLHGTGHSLAHVRGGWLALAVALMAASFLARAESWWVAVHAAMPALAIDRGGVRRALLIGMAGSAVAPGRLGEAVRAWLVARRAADPGPTFVVAVGTLLLQALINVVALLVLTGVALAGSKSIRAGALIGSGIAAVAGVAALLLAPRLIAGLVRQSKRRAGLMARWLAQGLLRTRSGLSALRRPRLAGHCACAQLGAWGLQLATCWVVLKALRLSPRSPVAAAAAVLVAVNVTAIVPVTPASVGVFQAACIAALAPFGVAASPALAYGLVLQAVEIACDLALGIPSVLREGVSLGEVRRATRHAPAGNGEQAPESSATSLPSDPHSDAPQIDRGPK
jgi:uncharacterized membrane protein YbhN (UPF0104 family)